VGLESILRVWLGLKERELDFQFILHRTIGYIKMDAT